MVAAWSFDAKDDLAACVAALGRQTLAPREVIVVIDHDDLLQRRQALPGERIEAGDEVVPALFVVGRDNHRRGGH
ncbi:MAG TPA: hypothetical protein VGI73_12435 [Solirubrobacterales bacterium]